MLMNEIEELKNSFVKDLLPIKICKKASPLSVEGEVARKGVLLYEA